MSRAKRQASAVLERITETLFEATVRRALRAIERFA
jgi:hypothetical protein